MLKQGNPLFSRDEAQEILDAADKDHDEQLDFDEFMDYMST